MKDGECGVRTNMMGEHGLGGGATSVDLLVACQKRLPKGSSRGILKKDKKKTSLRSKMVRGS